MEYFLVAGGLASYFNPTNHHQLINTHNLFNFIIDILLKLHDQEQKQEEIIQSLKINMGLTIFNQLNEYCIRKLGPDAKISKLVSSPPQR